MTGQDLSQTTFMSLAWFLMHCLGFFIFISGLFACVGALSLFLLCAVWMHETDYLHPASRLLPTINAFDFSLPDLLLICIAMCLLTETKVAINLWSLEWQYKVRPKPSQLNTICATIQDIIVHMYLETIDKKWLDLTLAPSGGWECEESRPSL